MILAELAKKDAQWRKMAFQICKDKDLADELVQEMYLKLAYNTNLIKDGYIYTVLRNLFYDYTKSNKDILVDFSNIEIEDIEYVEPVDYIQLMKGLTWYERTMFELSTLVGQRELSRQTGIHIHEIKAKRYARACEIRADVIFEDIIDIADHTAEDHTPFTGANVVQRDKLKIDARKWIVAKLHPKKYADRSISDVTVHQEQPLFPDVSTNDSNK
jgi:DNA-directed RNA polymerase specialized sigma24 family protein